MPNHVKNVLKVTGNEKEINKLMDFVSNDESPFTFEKINPTPSEDQTPDEYKESPIPSWYNWRCINWGTKWDAYEIDVDSHGRDEVYFNFLTAWSPPVPVLLTLSKKFKSLEFRLDFADEDLSYNLGFIIMKKGEIITEDCPVEGSDEAFEVAIDLWNLQDQYQLVDGEYVYVEPIGLN